MVSKIIFLMADYSHGPTETAIPWVIFHEADFEIHFATESGKPPVCDEKMLSGWTGALLGASKAAKSAYQTLSCNENFRNPRAWTEPAFNLDSYDLVFLPGGHDKAVQLVIDSRNVHHHVASYFPKTRKPSSKCVAAICHGVQVLASSSLPDGRSIIHDVQTTALPAFLEENYYKTYGAGTDSVEKIVRESLDENSQFKNSYNPTSTFVVHDLTYNYLSARFPPDAELLTQKAVELVNEACGTSKA
ncbi:class I glutamine amidotransferase-like protein [Lindgomyces ingoldianus]|uniref:Class I glutamine amidotransferase-like protein n=1 Tax=Lindgomyces ingoldianus TaxID=673940 RepID=A0ACB6R6N4_9PLEO|nr:class I glutamine amidotransferase-like protein [Lindgomyces ingoldianus]KAF2474192.1 class I glutamine amidotransferase-like protein [Lindgomyces ingoldianus]